MQREEGTMMSQLIEEILSQDNMVLVYKKVKANKGASGIDGIGMDNILAERGLISCVDYYLN